MIRRDLQAFVLVLVLSAAVLALVIERARDLVDYEHEHGLRPEHEHDCWSKNRRTVGIIAYSKKRALGLAINYNGLSWGKRRATGVPSVGQFITTKPNVTTLRYHGSRMKHEFIELTGKTLLDVVNEGEIDLKQLHKAGVTGDSILRINRHGEIELRKKSSWVLVGGLLGNFEERLVNLTGLDWAE